MTTTLITGGLLSPSVVTGGLGFAAVGSSGGGGGGGGTTLVVGGMLSNFLVVGGLVLGGSYIPVAQSFEQALVAQLRGIPELATLLGSGGIFKTMVPRAPVWDFGRNGAALAYQVPGKPRGHVLTGSDGTATARVQIDVYGYSESTVKKAVEALWNGIDGPPGAWGNGTCTIVSVVQQDEIDMDEPPVAKTDQLLYHTICEYSIMYRVAIPTLN